MRSKWLDATLASLRRVLANPSLESIHREKLEGGYRQLAKLRRSGKFDKDEVYRAVSRISEVLVETVLSAEEDSETTPEDDG